MRYSVHQSGLRFCFHLGTGLPCSIIIIVDCLIYSLSDLHTPLPPHQHLHMRLPHKVRVVLDSALTYFRSSFTAENQTATFITIQIAANGEKQAIRMIGFIIDYSA